MYKLKNIIILFTFCIVAVLPSLSYSAVFSDTLETSIYSDTTFAIDTTDVIDTLATELLYPKKITPIQNIGVVAPALSSDAKLDDSTIRHSNYRHLGNLLESFAGVFLYNFGSTGQPHILLSNYSDYRTIVFTNNGVPLNDPLTGYYNLNYFPTENIEQIEFINSTKAFLYTFNSTGSLVNMVSKFYNNNTPYTRLRYSESAYEETYLDGMFSQNILHNFNLTGGVQRIVADGRYANSEYNSWNVRLKLRHNISDNLNVYFSEIYNQNILGLNGGVDLENTATKDIFDEMRADVKYSGSYENVARNDLQLGAAGRFLPDTSSITQLIFYLSNQMRLFRDLQPPSAMPPIRESYHTRWYGAKLHQHLNLQEENVILNSLNIGTEIRSNQLLQSPVTDYKSKINAAIYAETEFSPLENATVDAYSRFDIYNSHKRFSFGSDATIKAINNFEITAGYSNSYRFPNFYELYWNNNFNTAQRTDFSPEQHSVIELGLGLNISDHLKFVSSYHHRTIKDAIVYEPTNNVYPLHQFVFTTKDKIMLQSLNSRLSGNFWKFSTNLNASLLLSSKYLTEFQYPDFTTNGELFFNDRFFNDNLNLRIGIKGNIISKQLGYTFEPRTGLMIPNNNFILGNSSSFDAIVLAGIGSALVHIVLENVLDNKYAIVSYYPIQDRTLRFGITWEFEN